MRMLCVHVVKASSSAQRTRRAEMQCMHTDRMQIWSAGVGPCTCWSYEHAAIKGCWCLCQKGALPERHNMIAQRCPPSTIPDWYSGAKVILVTTGWHSGGQGAAGVGQA